MHCSGPLEVGPVRSVQRLIYGAGCVFASSSRYYDGPVIDSTELMLCSMLEKK